MSKGAGRGPDGVTRGRNSTSRGGDPSRGKAMRTRVWAQRMAAMPWPSATAMDWMEIRFFLKKKRSRQSNYIRRPKLEATAGNFSCIHPKAIVLSLIIIGL